TYSSTQVPGQSGPYSINNYPMYAQSQHQQFMVQQTQQFYPQVTQAMHQSMTPMSLPITNVSMQVPASIAPNVPVDVPTTTTIASPQLSSSNTQSLPMSQTPQIDTNGDLVSPSLISSSPKKPKLRVQIPEAKEKQSAPNAVQQSQTIKSDPSPEQETISDSQQTMVSQPLQSSRPPGTTDTGPTSALPSQFAQNLPSPSTFFSEFYKTAELPSPLTFGNTPTSANPGAFPWPAPRMNYMHQPSPLAKHESSSNPLKNRPAPADDDDDGDSEPEKKKTKQ
ncbi:2286_t:CDS:2, partial [Racocetra fulgida]